jgi:hypothetical protein
MIFLLANVNVLGSMMLFHRSKDGIGQYYIIEQGDLIILSGTSINCRDDLSPG